MQFTIEEVASFTGLSTRAIRNYIRDGFLEGDKSSGKWLFSLEQYTHFTSHPNIAPIIKAKKKALIDEYTESAPDGYSRICVILDIVDHYRETVSFLVHYLENHSEEINNEDIIISIGPLEKASGWRVLIKGTYDLILDALAKFNEEKQNWSANK